MRFRNLAVLAGFAAMLGGCGTVDFSTLQPAALSGSLFVMWVDEGDGSGDGNFLFVPDPKDPLIFRRADPHQHGAVIQPGLMYTDGGSIPKIAQLFSGLSPWGYAPAYMIHDWIFTAHHCIVDGNDSARYDEVRDVTFDDSAAILGEAVRGLVQTHQVKPNDVAGTSITTAVDSSVARDLWDTRGACAGLQVSARDIARAEAATPGSSHSAKVKSFRVPETGVRATSVPPARIVAHIVF